jgi:hypothetical protein
MPNVGGALLATPGNHPELDHDAGSGARFLDERWIILGRRKRRPSEPWAQRADARKQSMGGQRQGTARLDSSTWVGLFAGVPRPQDAPPNVGTWRDAQELLTDTYRRLGIT